MTLANCSRCGSLFNKVTRDLCPQCDEEENQLLRDTQDYLRNHRNASKPEILDAVEDLDVALLNRWVCEGRIQLHTPEDALNKVYCMYCGREVTGGGVMCKTCLVKKKLSENKMKPPQPEIIIEEETKKRSAGMFVKKR